MFRSRSLFAITLRSLVSAGLLAGWGYAGADQSAGAGVRDPNDGKKGSTSSTASVGKEDDELKPADVLTLDELGLNVGDQGQWSATTGLSYSSSGGTPVTDVRKLLVPISLRYNVTDKFEVGLSTAYGYAETFVRIGSGNIDNPAGSRLGSSGFDDVTLRGTYRVYSSNGTTATVELSRTIPTDEPSPVDNVRPRAQVASGYSKTRIGIFAAETIDLTTLQGGINYSIAEERRTKDGVEYRPGDSLIVSGGLILSVTSSVALRGGWTGIFRDGPEIDGDEKVGDDVDIHQFQLGVLRRLSESWSLRTSVSFRIDIEDQVRVLANLTYRGE